MRIRKRCESAENAALGELPVWDALVVTAAREAGCEELWTEDLATGSELRGVRIVNPLDDRS